MADAHARLSVAEAVCKAKEDKAPRMRVRTVAKSLVSVQEERASGPKTVTAGQPASPTHSETQTRPSSPSLASCHAREEEEEDVGAVRKGYWWHVNKGGFPIPEATWEKMWSHVVDVHPDGAAVAEAIRGRPCRKIPFPSVPSMRRGSVNKQLVAVQTYLQQLQYNHTGTQFFDINKYRPLSRLMETAKEMIKESLPIKCLEAVIIALHLTAPLSSVQRFAIGFKSKCGDFYYRHIVLGVYHDGHYGVLGMSRRKDLMYKPLSYKSLFELIQDFLCAYKQYQHRVVKLKLSNPIIHDVYSCEVIQWKYLTLDRLHEDSLKKALDKYSRTIRSSSYC